MPSKKVKFNEKMTLGLMQEMLDVISGDIYFDNKGKRIFIKDSNYQGDEKEAYVVYSSYTNKTDLIKKLDEVLYGTNGLIKLNK